MNSFFYGIHAFHEACYSSSVPDVALAGLNFALPTACWPRCPSHCLLCSLGLQ